MKDSALTPRQAFWEGRTGGVVGVLEGGQRVGSVAAAGEVDVGRVRALGQVLRAHLLDSVLRVGALVPEWSRGVVANVIDLV